MKIQTGILHTTYGKTKKQGKTEVVENIKNSNVDKIEVSKHQNKSNSVHAMTKSTISTLQAECGAERIKELKAQIEADTYQVNANKIAKAMVQYHAFIKGE